MTQEQAEYNAADETKVKGRKLKDKDRRNGEMSDMRSIMLMPAGRRFVWRLLESSGVFRTSFTGNSTTFFNEGMRNIGLMVMGDVQEAASDLYIQMLNESKENKINE